MRTIIGLFAALSVGALSSAWATDPPAADATKAATPAASSTTSTTTSPAAADKATDGAKPVKLIAADTDADARLKRLKAAGYKPEKHGDELVFCRKEPVLGTRFDKKQCSTADQIEANTQNGQDVVSGMQRSSLSGNPQGH